MSDNKVENDPQVEPVMLGVAGTRVTVAGVRMSIEAAEEFRSTLTSMITIARRIRGNNAGGKQQDFGV